MNELVVELDAKSEKLMNNRDTLKNYVIRKQMNEKFIPFIVNRRYNGGTKSHSLPIYNRLKYNLDKPLNFLQLVL